MIRRSSGQRSRSRQNEPPSWTWLMFKVAADCVHKVSAQPKLTKLLFKRPAALHWIKCEDGEFSWTYSDQPYSADLHMPVLTLSAETHICTHTKSNHTHTWSCAHMYSLSDYCAKRLQSRKSSEGDGWLCGKTFFSWPTWSKSERI